MDHLVYRYIMRDVMETLANNNLQIKSIFMPDNDPKLIKVSLNIKMLRFLIGQKSRFK